MGFLWEDSNQNKFWPHFAFMTHFSGFHAAWEKFPHKNPCQPEAMR
jgi:hypothetical protein